MDIMFRVLKNNVSGGFIDDIANVYDVEDLTGYSGNVADWPVIVRNTPYLTLDDAKAFFNVGVKDVVSDPNVQIEVVRRCRYSINWSVPDKVIASSQGWIDLDYTNITIQDNA